MCEVSAEAAGLIWGIGEEGPAIAGAEKKLGFENSGVGGSVGGSFAGGLVIGGVKVKGAGLATTAGTLLIVVTAASAATGGVDVPRKLEKNDF